MFKQMSREKLKNVEFSLENLKQFAKDRFGSLKGLADAMGISQPQLSAYLSGKREFVASMRDRLEDVGFFHGLNNGEVTEVKQRLTLESFSPVTEVDVDGAVAIAETSAERLAKIMGIPLDTLQGWQTGTSKPSAGELARFINLVIALALNFKTLNANK